jgi:hypothetical protein
MINQTNFTHCYLNLPSLPDSIINDALASLETREREARINPNLFDVPGHKEYRESEVKYLDGKKYKGHLAYRYWISEEFDDWVQTHFKQESIGCGINIIEHQGPFFAPHVDANRSFSIHYLLDTGGDDVYTVWWKQKGKDIYRPDLKNNWNVEDTIRDYNDIEEIDRVKLKKHSWTCINTDILHSVEGLTRPRIAIQISRKVFPDFIDSYGISFIS